MGRKPKEKPEQLALPHMPEPTIDPIQQALEKRTRDPKTGLLPGFDYKFDEFGRVDWESLIPSKFYYPNRDRFGADIDISSLDVSELPPDKKILNLDGIRFLAEIRGLKKIEYKTGAAYPDYSCVTALAEWEPCIDQNMQSVSNSGVGEAHSFNNVAPFKYLLATLSMNKCFSRLTREICRIRSYATDELRGEPIEKEEHKSSELAGPSPSNVLDKVIQDHGYTFEKVREAYINRAEKQEEKEMARGWNSTKDIAPLICLAIIDKIKKAAKK